MTKTALFIAAAILALLYVDTSKQPGAVDADAQRREAADRRLLESTRTLLSI